MQSAVGCNARHNASYETFAMLVLTRKEGQRILIGDDIEITVVRISPSAVRIGVEAPKSCKIVRQEVEVRDDDVAGASLLNQLTPKG